ncbi:MAG: hypothetical protein IPG68_12375 [Micrococcales bacterium]|nr:hypothetical protein [Micrococcales bacterium]
MLRLGCAVATTTVGLSLLGGTPALALSEPSPAVAQQMWKLAPSIPVHPTGDLPCHRVPEALGVWKFTARGRQWGVLNWTATACSNGLDLVARRKESRHWTRITGFGYLPITPCNVFRTPKAEIDVPKRVVKRVNALFGPCGQVDM